MKTLKKFAHVNAKTVDEAAAILQRGKAINEANADAAGAAAILNAAALKYNKWKIPIAKAMVKRAILACA
jgi:hypothetical protein